MSSSVYFLTTQFTQRLFTGAVTALLTNPIWVVKVRLFTTKPDSPNAYRGLIGEIWSESPPLRAFNVSTVDGLYKVSKTEGFRGLWKGTTLALFGVTNGSLQFMTYELMKNWGFARRAKQMEARGERWSPDTDKLVCSFIVLIKSSDSPFQSNTYYTLISGASKLFALTATYPYQVVRARIQV